MPPAPPAHFVSLVSTVNSSLKTAERLMTVLDCLVFFLNLFIRLNNFPDFLELYSPLMRIFKDYFQALFCWGSMSHILVMQILSEITESPDGGPICTPEMGPTWEEIQG